MRQILLQRELRADRWRYAGEGGGGPLVQALAELLSAPATAGQSPETTSSLGVRLGPTDDVELLVPWLARVELVVVHFETGGDGRGYSQAQLLRGRFGYQGELRAAGAVRRDQLYLLARCGFDSFELAAGEEPRAALAHLDAYSVAYQHATGKLVAPRLRA